MRTTITIPEQLLKDLQELAKTQKTTAAVIIALEEWVRIKKIEKIKECRGKLNIENNLKELRSKERKKLDDLNG